MQQDLSVLTDALLTAATKAGADAADALASEGRAIQIGVYCAKVPCIVPKAQVFRRWYRQSMGEIRRRLPQVAELLLNNRGCFLWR